jgi:hypothetical protein
MVKVVLDDKDALHAIEDRLQKAVDYVIESNPKLRSGDRKLMRNRLTQLTSCLTLKVRHFHGSCSACQQGPICLASSVTAVWRADQAKHAPSR